MPIDRGVVDQQLQALGEGSRWWNERELRDLPAALHPDEYILAIARGKLARLRWLRRSWLIVVTDQRLLCMHSSSQAGWRQFEVSADQISRVALRVGPFRGRVMVVAGSATYRLLVPRPDAYKLSSALSRVCAPASGAAATFGPVRMVRRVIDHVLTLPAAALGPDSIVVHQTALPIDTSGIDDRFQALEDEVQELRRQVDFLEQLLRERHPESTRPSISG
jgi:hypothetical protein